MKRFTIAFRTPIARRSILLHSSLPRRLRTAHNPSRQSSFFHRPQIASLLANGSRIDTQSAGVPPNGAITINGFVRSIRKQKRVAFAAIGDGSSLRSLQAVLTPEQAEGLSTGTAVTITGRWQPSPSGKEQSYELYAQDVRIAGDNDSANPLQKKYHSPEFLRTIPHLRSRLPFHSLLLRLRSQLIGHITTFFAERGFTQTHPPLITSSDCEGAGEVFSVSPSMQESSSGSSKGGLSHYFGTPKYLTVSSQLHLESLAQAVGSVWALSPTFRAEKSDTPRHLSEFYMLEAEVAFTEDINEIMDIVEHLMRSLTKQLKHSWVGEDLLLAWSDKRSKDSSDQGVSGEVLGLRWEALLKEHWPRITYHRAIDMLQKAETNGTVNFEFKPSFGSGLQAEHEKWLTGDQIGAGAFDGPVFVTDYPRNIKPFYMLPSNESTSSRAPTVACFDLLLPGVCEVVGGSLREHRLDELKAAMQDHGMQAFSSEASNIDSEEANRSQPAHVNSLQWYIDLRSYESLPSNFSLSANMVAGAFAGIAEHSVMYPIDLLKTRMQVINPSPSAVYSGISNAMVTISRAEGFRAMWRGVSSVVVGAGPAHAVYFASYEAVKHALGGNEGGQEEHHPLAAGSFLELIHQVLVMTIAIAASGAAATIASDALMNPFDVIKQRMQLHGSEYRSLPQCARSVFRKEGLMAFYVSYPTTLCMTVPFTALQFMAYESMSKFMNPTGRYDPYTHCTAGGLAGGLAAGLTTPLDVIKTLLQTRGSATDVELRNVSGLWQAAAVINKRDGFKGFFRGWKPRIISTMPSTAICWSAYEMAKAFFISRNEA
ncbi:asparaginyl-tRNA synthetase [Pseudovirgaria hyperparasitica]|uniref:asparagine--tRNA ligase n=1 Tax=Pseudovirgaria hyperparasitica TaxID=470096 RepID=A0A6A6WF75_9PEZI|nr:asparaginyl-tRNA synthetase [Pseudovirgaria hyperparasitica]KAF2760684.1 asparaginyl-tRNA synthetase [Pseudovirgaria hyperparasitica]